MSIGKQIALGVIALVVLVIVLCVYIVWREPLALSAYLERRALKDSGFIKTAIETPGGRMIIWEAGQGPVLVFLHGAGDQAGVWSKAAPAFATKYHVILPDQPGHGESEPASGPLPMGTILGGLEALLQTRGTDQPVVLVGNSMGAWVAMLYAHRHPERVARIVLVDGGGLRWNNPQYSLTPASREEARKLINALMDPGSPAVPDFVLDDVIRTAHSGPISRLFATGADLERFLLDGKLGEIKIPAEILWGESDKLIPLDYSRRMQAELPAARLTTIPRCGHIPGRECPIAFQSALEKLLSQPPPEFRLAPEAPAVKSPAKPNRP